MPCVPFRSEDGSVTGWVCSRGRAQHRCKCGRSATHQCDFPLKGSKAGGTCDRWLCAKCAVHVGPNLDYCPAHAAVAKV
jgi:hypothetical protein